MTASHAGFIFLQCPHQGARNLIKTVLPSVMSSQLRGVGERVTSYIRKRRDAGAALVGSELDGRGRTEQRERDEQFHRPARALSSVRGRHTRRKRARSNGASWRGVSTPTNKDNAGRRSGCGRWLLPRFSAWCSPRGGYCGTGTSWYCGNSTVPTVNKFVFKI